MTRAMRTAWLAVCAVFVLGTGCDGPAGPTPVGDATLTGTWRLVSLRPAGQPAQTVPGDAAYQLTLDAGRLSARADCNTCSGRYTLAGNILSTGSALACTRAACATAAFEATYTAMLAGDHAVAVTATSLTLTAAGGTLVLSR